MVQFSSRLMVSSASWQMVHKVNVSLLYVWWCVAGFVVQRVQVNDRGFLIFIGGMVLWVNTKSIVFTHRVLEDHSVPLVGVACVLFGWWGLKRNGQPQKPLKRRPYFFCVPCGLWPRVRFCTVEALCRYVLSHSTPPFSSSFLIREVHCGKSTQSPAVMQKVRGRHDTYLNLL